MSLRETIESDNSIIYRLHGDKVIWMIVILLSIASVALIYSSSSSLAFKEGSTNFDYLLKQVGFVAMGLVFLFIAYKIPLGVYRAAVYLLFGVSLVLLTLTPIIGVEINHAKRWLEIGPVSFQPAEIVKITLIMYIAKTIELCRLETFREFFWRIIVPAGYVCLVILLSSVSTAIVVGLISLLVLIIAGVKWSHIFKAAGIAAATFIVAISLHLAFDIFPRFDTATNRIKGFFATEEEAHQMTAEEKQLEADKTFQADMAEIAISSGKIIGKGPGKSTQRYVLPHPYSDFIYSIIIEEYGIVGGAVILLFYLQLLYRCVMLVRNCTRKFSAITVGGIGLMIVLQAFLHILVNVGILPVTGHTLPLVSLGGTSYIIFSIAFGIILSVSRTIEKDNDRKARELALAAEEAGSKIDMQSAEGIAANVTAEESDEEVKQRTAPARKEELHEIIDQTTGEFK